MKISTKAEQLIEQLTALKKVTTPTYPALGSVPVEEARLTLDQVFGEFLQLGKRWNDEHRQNNDDNDEDNPFLNFAEEILKREMEEAPPVRAICITTGVGKTERVIAMLARYILARWEAGDKRSWLYLVPTIWLGEHIDDKFRAQGLIVKVYRGLTRADPNIPGNMDLPPEKREQMCLAPEKRKLAESLHKSVSSSCCKYKKQRCEFHPEGSGRRKCGYQTQILGEQPHIWIAAHNMEFHPQKAFGDIAGIIVDEGFVIKSGVYGVGKKKDEEIPGMLLDDIAADGDTCPWRKELIEALREHPLGGLRADLVDIIASISRPLKYYTSKEWEIVNSLTLTPEMSPAQIKEIRESEAATKCRRARWMAGTWLALFDLLDRDQKKNFDIRPAEGNKRLMLAERKKDGNVEISGRLSLAKNKAGKLVLQRRGIRKIVDSRRVPTFCMDATLPDVEILRVFFPQIREEDITRVDVDMPEHVHVTQVLGTKTAELKLWGRGDMAEGKNREDVKRFILQWWLEDDRRSMLVICQKEYERWLRANLPKEILVPPKSKRELQWDEKAIAIEHYNDVSGLDIYRNVSSILLIGRIQPTPQDVQDYAGALLGTEPSVMFKPRQPNGKPGEWFKPPVTRAIRMKDGSGILVEGCDRHPDPLCEAVRLLQCEGEIIQAFGRARAVNRTAANPLRAAILNDVVCDLTVNSVRHWAAPIEVVEPLALDGLVPTTPGDMSKGWPGIWPTPRAAKWTLKKLGDAARRARATTEDIFSRVYLILEKMSPVLSDDRRAGAGTESGISSVTTILYQRPGERQKLRKVLVDLRIWPSPREGLIKKLGGLFAALLQILSRREIGKPLAGNGKAFVDATVQPTTATVRALVDQLPLELRVDGQYLPLPLSKADYERVHNSEAVHSKAFDAKMRRIAEIEARAGARALGLHEAAIDKS
jgi:hypothetical protein